MRLRAEVSHVVVLGAGVVGVATAWLLCRAGHRVTLVDRHAGPAQGTSQANGAQLSYAYCDALSSPAMRRKLPAIAFGRDPAFRVRLQADPEFWIWGLRFLVEASPDRFVGNTRHLLAMAARTRELLQELLHELPPLSFDHAVSGKMILYDSAAACDAAGTLREIKRQMRIEQHVLSRAEASAIEPALDLYPDAIERVLYSPADAVGRPDAFCSALVEALRSRFGLVTRFGEEATGIVQERKQVVGLALRGRAPVPCDELVLATGSATALLPWRDRPWGGLWPVQGYSITARATNRAMQVSVTDLKRKIVFARLGGEVRVAGMADLGARACRFDARRFETFQQSAVEAFGPAFSHGPGVQLQPWTGGRPCTPSSRPVVRAGSLRGLYLNLGHGTLGWTLCLGSAQQLLEIMPRHSPASGAPRHP